MTVRTPYVILQSTQRVQASVAVPGSKSIANRQLILAALADGESRLRGVPACSDVERVLTAFQRLGIEAQREGEEVSVRGTGGHFRPVETALDFGGSGTGLRFTLGLLSLFPRSHVRIDGDGRMRERPLADLLRALRTLGVNFVAEGAADAVPLLVQTGERSTGREDRLRGSESSQFTTALLMAAPYMRGGLQISLPRDHLSAGYVTLTLSLMEQAGVTVTTSLAVDGEVHYMVPEGRYRPQVLTIEPDASSAGYLFALAALTSGTVRVPALTRGSRQPDIGILAVLQAMGCVVRTGSDESGWIEVTGPTTLHGGEWNLREMPDSAMTLAVVAACAEGVSVYSGLETLPLKESHRLEALSQELRRVGAEVVVHGATLKVIPQCLRATRIESHGDHRMAMAFALLGARLPGLEVAHPEVVAKSFPGFWGALKQCGMMVEQRL